MYQEKLRPQFHYSPREMWMNDPNGLVYYDGEYHLFYQYHPHSAKWGPMHWGHAVSTDLLHWKELPIALYPDELGMIFSGSAVIDEQNTSGLQNSDEDVMIAIFTHHEADTEKQTQSIAYSNDKGRTWEKYKNNPVIDNPGIIDFRDPKVFWHEDSQKWIMTLACGDHIQFYSSPNLLEWDYLSSFGEGYGSHDGVWECPDLLHVPVEGESEKKWVLIVSINPGGPNGGSAVQYFTGEFDGQSFVCDDSQETIKWADYGRDYYAAVTWSNVDDPTWIGWMSNWDYANETPTDTFRSMMSIPRKLGLRMENGALELFQNPIDISSLHKEEILTSEEIEVSSDDVKQVKIGALQFSLVGKVKENKADHFKVAIKGESDKLDIVFDRQKEEFHVNRVNSGHVDFSDKFASIDKIPVKDISDFQILVDKTSIEIFLNHGSHVITDLFFPTEEEFTLEFSASKGTVKLTDVELYELKSIWNG